MTHRRRTAILRNGNPRTWLVFVVSVSSVLLCFTYGSVHLLSGKIQRQQQQQQRQGELLANAKPTGPYEERWPGWKLPQYAKKSRDAPHVPVPKEKETCFVHVGKTAGSTVGCSLGFRLHCTSVTSQRRFFFFHQKRYKRAPILPGALPQYTTHLFHRGINDCPSDAAYYLFVIRNPLERAKSAYAYDRKDGQHVSNATALLYNECPFQTLNDLAEQGLAEDGTASDICQQRARDAIRGTKRYSNHLYYNYAYYANETTDLLVADDTASGATQQTNTAAVLVIRTEHLTEDWNTAEQFVGDDEGEKADFPVRNNNDKRKTNKDKFLSKKARILVCAALCDDIQVYKDIVRRAINLNATQVEATMVDLRHSCPVEADVESCPRAVSSNSSL